MPRGGGVTAPGNASPLNSQAAAALFVLHRPSARPTAADADLDTSSPLVDRRVDRGLLVIAQPRQSLLQSMQTLVAFGLP